MLSKDCLSIVMNYCDFITLSNMMLASYKFYNMGDLRKKIKNNGYSLLKNKNISDDKINKLFKSYK
jgi:hypothetical protein